MKANGWRAATLGEICDQVGGVIQTGPFGSQLHESDYSLDGIPVVMPKDIDEGRIVTSDIARVAPDHVERLSRHKLEVGDIVYGRRGDIGRQALVRVNERGWLCGTGCLRLSLGDSIVDSAFLHYYLRQDSVIAEIAGRAVGATLPNLNTAILRSVRLRFPSLPIQREIAGTLSSYDELIENNWRRIRVLEAMVRALYREWVVDFRFPTHRKAKHVGSRPGAIPSGWVRGRLGDVAEEVRRNVPKGELEEARPFVGLEHIPRRSLALDAWEMVTSLGSNKLEFKRGEILFGKIRPYFHKVSIAPFDGLCSADTIVIRPKRAADFSLVAACASSDEFVAHASATANGAKMPRANWEVLKEFPIVLPSENIARPFRDLFEGCVTQQQVLVQQIHNLREARDLLLPRLLSGQTRIGKALQ